MNQGRYRLYVELVKRAEKQGFYSGDRLTLLMDIESADKAFNIRLEEWLTADDVNFGHDILGIIGNVNRSSFPSIDFGHFVPRFAGE